jgi:hypothetical protein
MSLSHVFLQEKCGRRYSKDCVFSLLLYNHQRSVLLAGGLRQSMELQKGLNSPINLVAWEIWKHQNDYVFNGTW